MIKNAKEHKLNGDGSRSHLQFMLTLNVFVFPVESSLYASFFTVPQVKVPISNVVPPICNPGKWQRVFLAFRLPLNAYEDPFKVPVFTRPPFSPVAPTIEIDPVHLPLFLSAVILK